MGGNYEYPVMEEQERRQDHWDYGLQYTRGDSYYGRERNGVEEMPLIRNDVENRGPCRTDVAMKDTKFFPVGQGFRPKINAMLNSRKVSDHHAIIPTIEITSLDMGTLSEGEKMILLLIANRLICAVSNPYRYKRVYIQLACNNNIFEAAGTKVIDSGYREYEDRSILPKSITEWETLFE